MSVFLNADIENVKTQGEQLQSAAQQYGASCVNQIIAEAGISTDKPISEQTPTATMSSNAVPTPGEATKFYGVSLRIIPESIPFNSFFGGAINTQASIVNEYTKLGLDSRAGRLLMHEFGHFLQEQNGGSLWYNLGVAPSSLVNIISLDVVSYRGSWTEIQANTMAYYYFDSPSFWRFDLYPIDDNYISIDIKNYLLNHK
jgi:hypothetical protein